MAFFLTLRPRGFKRECAFGESDDWAAVLPLRARPTCLVLPLTVSVLIVLILVSKASSMAFWISGLFALFLQRNVYWPVHRQFHRFFGDDRAFKDFV